MENNNRKFYKGFRRDLTCRNYQFEIGKEYKIETDKKLKLCSNTVFHFCDNLKDLDKFYDIDESRICEIKVLGELVEDEEKCGSNHIKIVRELAKEEIDRLTNRENGNIGRFNTGCHNVGSHNLGHFNTGNCNIGDYNTGNRNTGNRNTGDFNTGNCNTGDYNTGNRNTGDFNTGNRNTGDYNTGNRNTGIRNTGDFNTGNRNTGDFNTGNFNTGFFNTITPKMMIFNKPTNLDYMDFIKKYGFIFNDLELTAWIEYSEEEKKDSIIRQCIGGYLKKYSYEEMWQNWYSKKDDMVKTRLFSIPNFDVEIFEEITGIDTRNDYNRLTKKEQ